MARYSSLTIPSGAYHLRIFDYLVDMFGGDVCCAAIVGAIDWLTAAKLGITEAAEDKPEGLLWVQISPGKFSWLTCGLYSSKRIQERLVYLLKVGVLRAPEGQTTRPDNSQKPMAFLLDRNLVDDFAKMGVVLPFPDLPKPPERVGTNVPDRPESQDILVRVGTNAGQMSQLVAPLRVKEVNLLDLNINPKTNEGPESQDLQNLLMEEPLSSPMDLITASQQVAHWIKRLKGVHGNISSTCRAIITGKVSGWLDRMDELECRFNAFRAEDFHNGFDPSHRIRAFFKYAEESGEQYEPSTLRRKPAQVKSEGHTPTSDTPVSATVTETANSEPVKEGYFETWNRIIPDRAEKFPVGTGLGSPATLNERVCRAIFEPDFQSNIGRIVERAAEVIRNNPEDSGWLDAYWPLKTERDTGRYNYRKLLNKDFMKPRKSKGGDQAGALSAIAKVKERMRLQIEKNESHT